MKTITQNADRDGAPSRRAVRALAWGMLCMMLSVVCTQTWAASVLVNVGGVGNGFSPQTVTIDPGDRVVFVNKGGYHNVVADDASFRCALGCDGDGNGGSGQASRANWVASVTFSQPGRIGYFCEIHGAPGTGMYGTVVVRAPPTPATVPGLGWELALLLACALMLLARLALKAQ